MTPQLARLAGPWVNQLVARGGAWILSPCSQAPCSQAVLSGAVFSDAAALYDLLNPWDPDHSPSDRCYEELVMAADSVVDIGCGTGAMLHLTRERGHPGRPASSRTAPRWRGPGPGPTSSGPRAPRRARGGTLNSTWPR